MNRSPLLALIIPLALMLAACGSGKSKKKKDLMGQTLGQRLDRPDTSRSSHYQKYMSNSSNGRNITAKWQKQSHHQTAFGGANRVKGLNHFKTSEAGGLSSSKDGKAVFSGAGQASWLSRQGFETSTSRDGSKMSREGSGFFRDGSRVFGADAALPSSQRMGREPKIIENRAMDSTGSAYSEDEVRRLLGRP